MSKCPVLSYQLPQVSITRSPSLCQKLFELLATQGRSTAVFVELVIFVHSSQLTPELCRAISLQSSRARPSARGCATRSVAQNEARKRRASERARVGCDCELDGLLQVTMASYSASQLPDAIARYLH